MNNNKTLIVGLAIVAATGSLTGVLTDDVAIGIILGIA